MTKIFLVDDEPLVLIGMQGMLNWAELGYTVVGTARNGAEALKAIGETYPDIVVSDIRMPVMDGFTLAESCHKDGSALPVFIMLTSYEEFDYVKRSMRLGVVDYLVKIDLTAESLTKNSIVKCNNFLLIFLYILSHHNKAVNIHSFVGSLL